MAPDAILGRERELAHVVRFSTTDPAGPRALVIEGEAGIGKTTIWREATRLGRTRGHSLEARAWESETSFSFSVLGDLLEPVAGEILKDLPLRQRGALEAALLVGTAEGPGPDSRAVGLATIGAFRTLASRGPVTIGIDDVQWTDPPSLRVLSFACRRLVDEPISLILAYRVDRERPAVSLVASAPHVRSETITLGPLAPDETAALLRERSGGKLSRTTVARIHEAAGGNPFFALEIAGAIERDGLPVSAGDPLPVPADARALIRARTRGLSEDARRTALLAAAAAHPTIDELTAAGASRSAIDAAERAGILEIRHLAVDFAHPLLRSASYAEATSGARREAHRALARAVHDPEQRARHLALQSDGPDEHVASELEEAAMQARSRGAPLAAADLQALAARMTPKADLEAERLRRQWSAANLFDAGDTREARDRIERLLAELEPGHGRADSSFLLSIMSWNDVRAVTRALERALAEAGDDKLLRAKTLADFGWARLQVRDLAGASAHARAALKLAEEIGDSFCLRLALSVLATAEHLLGQPSTDLLRRAMSLEGALVHAEASTATICFARQQTYAGDLDGARATLESELHRFEEQGRETATWEIQNDLAQIEYRAGRWNVAMDHAETAREISQDAGLDVLAEILPVMTATETARGRVDVARTLGEEGLGICERTGDRWHELFLRAGLGFLAISLDDAAEANSWMDPAIRSMQAMGLEEPGFCPLIPDEVEALVMLGELEQAKALTDWLAFRGRALDRPLARATASRCQGLITAALGDGSGALAYLDRAIEEHSLAPQPFELGRTLLVSGRIQRRTKKKKPAREALEQARAIFDELGAPLWSAKASAELARIGGRTSTENELTATEIRVASLVAEGHTNREVANALFMSIHTVDANLRRIYRKLGVRSRSQLAGRF